MNAVRKLSIVGCPQRDGEPIRELVTGDGKHLIFGHDGHGCAAWSYLPHTPTAYESAIIARSQSRRTKSGVRAEPWSFEESLRDLAAANKPRRVTVPEPLHSHTLAGVPAKESQMAIHASPCNCSDDAQRHWALVARDLIASGRESELTDDMRQAYDYEFGGVPEPEAPQVPEF